MTVEQDPVEIDLSLPNVVQKAVKENISYQHGFDEDPWSELTSTREILKPGQEKNDDDLKNLLDLNEHPTQTQSFGFDKFQSDEAMSLKTSEISIETLQSTESIALDDHRSMTEQSIPQPQKRWPDYCYFGFRLVYRIGSLSFGQKLAFYTKVSQIRLLYFISLHREPHGKAKKISCQNCTPTQEIQKKTEL